MSRANELLARVATIKRRKWLLGHPGGHPGVGHHATNLSKMRMTYTRWLNTLWDADGTPAWDSWVEADWADNATTFAADWAIAKMGYTDDEAAEWGQQPKIYAGELLDAAVDAGLLDPDTAEEMPYWTGRG